MRLKVELLILQPQVELFSFKLPHHQTLGPQAVTKALEFKLHKNSKITSDLSINLAVNENLLTSVLSHLSHYKNETIL